MISNYEFIKTQAFELSWAVFRCTELFSQDKLRKEVEAAAVELITDSGAISNTLESEFPRIETLTSLIRLAESVGQIASVNANVLYRELDNLAKAIRLEVVERREKKNITTSLERIFTNSAYTNNLQSITDNGEQNANSVSSTIVSPVIPAEAGIQSVQKSVADNSASQFGSIEQLLSAAAKSSQPINNNQQQKVGSAVSAHDNPLGQFMQMEVRESAQPNSTIRQATSVAQSPAVATTTFVSAPIRQVQVAAIGSWQSVILQKVKDLGQTTTKELTASFPEISERTIRFYLQKLVDNGLIDRIGSTGPGAAYKAK